MRQAMSPFRKRLRTIEDVFQSACDHRIVADGQQSTRVALISHTRLATGKCKTKLKHCSFVNRPAIKNYQHGVALSQSLQVTLKYGRVRILRRNTVSNEINQTTPISLGQIYINLRLKYAGKSNIEGQFRFGKKRSGKVDQRQGILK